MNRQGYSDHQIYQLLQYIYVKNQLEIEKRFKLEKGSPQNMDGHYADAAHLETIKDY